MPPIVTITGTSRPENYTAHALAVVNDELDKAGASVRSFDARRMTLAFPGFPPTDDARELIQAIQGASGVVLASPEYHGSFCAMTKLIIENLGFPSVLKGKAVGLLGVAGGRIGAIKTLEQLRGVCSHVGAVVMPGAVSIAGVRGAFDEEGRPSDAGTEESLRGFARNFRQFIGDFVCPKFALEAMARTEGKPWTTSV